MKSFFKIVLAVIVASLIMGAIFFFVMIGFIGSLSKETQPRVKANTVLKLDFKKPIPELSDNAASSGGFSLENDKTLGLTEYLQMIEQAKNDSRIKGIYLDLEDMHSNGLATMTAIRKALVDCKAAGKFIYAYANSYSQKAYYFASVSDKVYLNPRGAIDFRGLSAELTFFKNMLDKIGVKADVFYCGKFKSATEPFRRADMSPENRIQMRAYIESVYNALLEDISASRNISVADLRSIANEFKSRDASGALAAKLVDGLVYKDQVIDEIRTKLGLKDTDQIPVMDMDEYYKANKPKKNFSDKSKIAVVYAEGNIVDGDATDPGQIAGEHYAQLFRTIREDKDVKAVVLRINSGGGSAMASEVMWREIERLKQSGKVVIASMGDVAASGGYYIASNANKIFAERNTITGSIGVFGMIPHGRQLLEKTMGITMDTVKTGKYSALDPFYYEMTDAERNMIQSSVDSTYMTFKTRVANGRHLSLDKVEEIAQGRVWIGTKALEIGLVDTLGNLNDAIQLAAKMAGITKYRIKEYPQVSSKLDQIVKSITGGGGGDKPTANPLSQVDIDIIKKYYQTLCYVRSLRGIQMRMPFDVHIE